jgi:ApaG protein
MAPGALTRSVYRALLRSVGACVNKRVPLEAWREDALACLGTHAAAALDVGALDAASADAEGLRATLRTTFRRALPADAETRDALLDGALSALRRLHARQAAHRLSSGRALATSSRCVSHGIVCEVKSTYLPARSTPGAHWFTYEVTFLNEGAHPVQLSTRQWAITTHFDDGSHTTEHVRGPGVVGQHPRLLVGESFKYASFCVLRTTCGSMRGSFEWVALTGEDTVRTRVHGVRLLAPHATHPAQYSVACDPFALVADL